MVKPKLNRKKVALAISLGLVLGIVSLIISIPKLRIINTNAEISTQGDWIGLFPIEGSGMPARNNKTDTYLKSNGTYSWMWAGDASEVNRCRFAPFAPHLSGSCSPFNDGTHSPTGEWEVPSGGAYEFRLYANDATAAAMVGQSMVYWGDMSSNVNINCMQNSDGSFFVDIFWPNDLVVTNDGSDANKGLRRFELHRTADTATSPVDSSSILDNIYVDITDPSTYVRDTGLYQDNNEATGSAYRYWIWEYSKGNRVDKRIPIPSTGADNHYFGSISITLNPGNCNPSWLKTSGGDVHSNR